MKNKRGQANTGKSIPGNQDALLTKIINMVLESPEAEKIQMTEFLTSLAANSFENARLTKEIRETKQNLIDTLKREQSLADLVRNTERRLNKSQAIAHLGSWELDLSCNELTWSDEVYRIFGLKPQEFKATYEAFLESVHPDDSQLVNDAYLDSIRSGKNSYEIEHRIIKKSDGEVRTVYEKCEHNRDESGKIILSIGMVHDITENKKYEKALEHEIMERKRSEAELQKLNLDLQRKMNEFNILFESLHQPVFVFNSEGKVLQMNPAAFKILGSGDSLNLTGLSIDTLFRKFKIKNFDGTDVKKDELPAIRALAGENVKNKLFKVIDFKGEEIIFTISSSPLILEGNVIGAVSLWYESKEALRKTAEELKRSNYELEQFAYVSSHDLQEPLRQVTSFTSLLAKSLSEKLDSNQHQYMQFITEGSQQMSNVIHDLLTFSRVGRNEEKFKSTSLNEVLINTISILKTTINDADASITYDELPVLKVVPTQITQLFQNLLTNAIKFRIKGVRPQIHIGGREEEKAWLFWVKDNGIGIEPQYFEKIFRVFQRLHARGEYEGTGIGLAICKKIVEQHKGNILVESKPYEGSTFYFTISREI